MTLTTRTYGSLGPAVVLLHGGPGAPGTMAPVARGLADAFRVVEPLQRRSGPEPLTVARHVADLHEVIEASDERPALVGSSWGAMLALAYAARHPEHAGPIVLIGCGTFDRDARARMLSILEKRIDPDLRDRLERLVETIADPDDRLRERGRLILPLYSWDPISDDLEGEAHDALGYRQTWVDMERLQGEGVYPAGFAAIRSPVLMLHGTYDPHPGRMVRDSLQPHLAKLEYREWRPCGHYPWIERHVREEFFMILRSWLANHLSGD